jgi:hypothetical protein
LTEYLRALALVPLVVAAGMRRIERRTIVRVTDAGANAPERAVLLQQTGMLGGFVHRRLMRSGVLTAAGNDRYYFSAAAYAAFCRRRRRRALVVGTILLAGLAVAYYRGDFS